MSSAEPDEARAEVRTPQSISLGRTGRSQAWETGDKLANHIELIQRQVELSMNDPETRSLAVAITSGAFDRTPDPVTGVLVPVVPYHGRLYRGARDWRTARIVCGAKDDLCELTAIWNFCVLNIRYLQDTVGQDTYQTLRATLEAGGGDCDDCTIAITTLAGAVGYESVASVISLDGKSWQHIYPVVKTRRGWVAMDMTEAGKKPGWEFPSPAARQNFALVGHG